MSSGSRARTHTQRVKLRSDSVLSSVRKRRATAGPSSPASPIASGSSRTQGGGSSRWSALATAVRTAVRLGRRGVTVNAGEILGSSSFLVGDRWCATDTTNQTRMAACLVGKGPFVPTWRTPALGGRPGTRTRMGCPTRPSNVRVYQFRQPPLLRRQILPGTAFVRQREDRAYGG